MIRSSAVAEKREDMAMMNDSDLSGRKSLTLTSKEKDGIVCRVCGEGILIPFNPAAEINHGFTCNKCGCHVNLDTNVTVE